MSDLFEWQLSEPGVVQHVLALGRRGVPDLYVEVVCVKSTVLTDALLHLQHSGPHITLTGLQLELLLAPESKDWDEC